MFLSYTWPAFRADIPFFWGTLRWGGLDRDQLPDSHNLAQRTETLLDPTPRPILRQGQSAAV